VLPEPERPLAASRPALRLAPAPGRPARPPLRLVPPPDQAAARRRSRALVAVVGLLVCAGLFAVLALRVMLIQGQARVDELESRAATERSQAQRLAMVVADLEAPDRVTEAARERLGMVVPESVTPLQPASQRPLLTVDFPALASHGT
jgi:cell division protein FtsB